MKNMYEDYLRNDPFIKTYMMPAVIIDDSNYNNRQVIGDTFLNPEEGFLKGNMEKGTYIPYKNMTYLKPVINNEKERHLYEIQKLSFAAHDANLYLDTHPEDVNMIKLYSNYINEEKRLCDLYEKKYGPIDLSDTNGLDVTPWSWIKEPWPWNK